MIPVIREPFAYRPVNLVIRVPTSTPNYCGGENDPVVLIFLLMKCFVAVLLQITFKLSEIDVMDEIMGGTICITA